MKLNPSEPEFLVILVTEDIYERSQSEMMGSKYKFWFHHEELGRCLYKQIRTHTGEDWAEKIAAELSELLEIPHARYELAETWEGNYGVVSPSFVLEGGTLVHGNEILAPLVPNYPTFATYNASQHTIDVVLGAIEDFQVKIPRNWTAPNSIQTAVDLFVGYLLLDAWIGNGDRHHENWGFVRQKTTSTSGETTYLAPTYDHASSLGRELSEPARQKRSVEAYVNKCLSAFYASVNDRKPLKTFDLFSYVAHRYPEAANVWLTRLEDISLETIHLIFSRIPSQRISPIAAEFAKNILQLNQNRLISVRKSLS